ncbi:Scn11a [Symbiodinium sp. CCMP2592]|nr:Scn11a [Symbiodinium sp. CCMP2592]
MPQKLLHRSGPFGLLARTATWWEHVPAGGNLHWQDANTCGNVGLSNPKFASHQAFRDAVLGILREGAQYKRECPAAPTQKCPPWPEYSCGVTEGMKYQVMPVERAWVDHMELRAIVGNLVQGRPWDIKKDKWDDAKVIYKWQDQKGPWTGKQGWPRDPFVAGFYDFYDQPIGFKPPEGRFLGRAGEHEVTDKDYLNLCCTLLMSSSSKDEYATKLATYPLYFLWFTKLEKDDKSFSNSVGKKPEWAFLKKSNVNMSCSVDTCNRQTPPPPSSSSNCDAPVKVTLTGKTGPDRRVAACDAETARKELTERLKAEKKLQDGEECVLNCDGSQRTTEKCCCEFFQDGTETANPKFKTDRQPGIPALMQGQTRTSENQTETELRFELRIESGMDKDLVAATDSVGWGSAADRDGFLSQLHDKGVFKASQLSSLKEEDLSLPNDQLVRSRFHEVQAQQEATRLGAGANQAEIEARRQQLRQEVSQDLDRTQNLLNSALADAQNAVQQGSDALQSKAKELRGCQYICTFGTKANLSSDLE